LFKEHRVNRTEIAIVGFYGQTVFHPPASRLIVRIGDGPGLARRLGMISALPTWPLVSRARRWC
jgi:anhydro-N-acetylmuramic acid kinase